MTAHTFMANRGAPLRLVIFDCDGVLVDSEPLANRVTARHIAAEGWPITPQECVERFVGLNLEAMVPVIEAHLGRRLADGWVHRLTDDLIATLAVESVPIHGALEALQAITALGLPWRVASNSSHGEMRAKFASIGATDLVMGRLHSYTDVREGKPAPDLFLAAAAAEAIAPENCIVIEDSVTGARAAAAAGMPCLGYAPDGDHAGLRATGARLFAAMADLPGLIAAAPR